MPYSILVAYSTPGFLTASEDAMQRPLETYGAALALLDYVWSATGAQVYGAVRDPSGAVVHTRGDPALSHDPIPAEWLPPAGGGGGGGGGGSTGSSKALVYGGVAAGVALVGLLGYLLIKK